MRSLSALSEDSESSGLSALKVCVNEMCSGHSHNSGQMLENICGGLVDQETGCLFLLFSLLP